MKLLPQEIKDRYNTYKKLGNLRATAKLYNITFQALAMLFKYHNLPANKIIGNKIPHKQIEITNDVLSLSKTHSVLEIAHKLKCNECTIRKVLLSHNITPAKKRFFPPHTEKLICSLYSTTSANSLSKQFNVSFPTILSILKRHNTPIRPRGAGSHFHKKELEG
jgi:hypothetical protein